MSGVQSRILPSRCFFRGKVPLVSTFCTAERCNKTVPPSWFIVSQLLLDPESELPKSSVSISQAAFGLAARIRDEFFLWCHKSPHEKFSVWGTHRAMSSMSGGKKFHLCWCNAITYLPMTSSIHQPTGLNLDPSMQCSLYLQWNGHLLWGTWWKSRHQDWCITLGATGQKLDLFADIMIIANFNFFFFFFTSVHDLVIYDIYCPKFCLVFFTFIEHNCGIAFSKKHIRLLNSEK